jgi:4-amino-4-deoxy-L-arabinose transferase-like glycosyltransferase
MVPLVFVLGRHLYDQRTGLWAAGLAAFYPSLWGHDYLLLTEVLFTFLLVAGTVAAVADAARPRWALVAVAGIAFGLGALTRTSLLLYPPLFAIATFAWCKAPSARRIATVTLFTATFALTIAPWIVRNTRLNGRLSSIDSYSNSTAARFSPLRHLFEKPGSTWATRPPRERDGTRAEADDGGTRARRRRRERLAESSSANASTGGSEGRPAAASGGAESGPPVGFSVHLRRAVRGVVWDGLLFWRIDREIAAAAADGRLGSMPRPVLLVLTASIAGYYVVLALAAAVGLFLRPPEDRLRLGLLLSVVVVLFAVHTFSVGHSRYHIPLMPLLAVFAARLWVARGQTVVARRLVAGLVAASVLIASWTTAFVRYDLVDVRNKLERSERRPADGRID